MTKPTIDERIEELRTAWQFGNGPGYLEALAIIDELKEDLEDMADLHETHLTHLKAKLDAFMPPEEAIVLRKRIAELEAENARLRKVLDKRPESWVEANDE